MKLVKCTTRPLMIMFLVLGSLAVLTDCFVGPGAATAMSTFSAPAVSAASTVSVLATLGGRAERDAATAMGMLRGGEGGPMASAARGLGSDGGANGGLQAYHGGGSGPPRNRGLGGWGSGAGGDGGGDGGAGGRDHVERTGDLAAFGAAQAMVGSRRWRYGSYYGRGGGRRSPYRRQASMHRESPSYNRGPLITVTKALTALNVVMFALQSRFPSITRAGWKLAPAILGGQYYRLITPVVLHGSLAHLLVNSLSFNSVGPVVEKVMGRKKFLATYLLSGAAGNVLSCIVNPHMPAVGASGAIFGMVGAWAAFCVMNESVLGRVNSQRALKNVGQTVMINVLYGMSSSQIDNMGHLGGFLGGALVTLLIGPRLRMRLNPLTGERYTVDVSPKLSLPRFGNGARNSRDEKQWP